jgi:prepilin-type processing-associated H-X9-DG protein
MIGQAILLYAYDHGGQYPDSLRTLVQTEDLPVEMLVCPSSSDSPATGTTMSEIDETLAKPGHASYVYLGRGLSLTTAPARAVVAYEPLANDAFAMNVLFGDGNVEPVRSVAARQLLAQFSKPSTLPSSPPIVWQEGH